MYVALVPYSPPTESPCSNRAISSNAGAATPTLAYVGSTATINEPAHIMMTAIIIDTRRPRLSAMRPKNQLPTGRMRKPAAKTPAAFNSCVVWSPAGKNSEAKYSAVNE